MQGGKRTRSDFPANLPSRRLSSATGHPGDPTRPPVPQTPILAAPAATRATQRAKRSRRGVPSEIANFVVRVAPAPQDLRRGGREAARQVCDERVAVGRLGGGRERRCWHSAHSRSARWRRTSSISSLWRPYGPYCSTTRSVGSHASRGAHAGPLHITTTRASARRGNARGLTQHTACARTLARARSTHAMHDGRTARAARADARGRRGARTGSGAQNTRASRHTGRHGESRRAT